MTPPVTVVVATRDRRERLLETLGRLRPLGVPVVVVDNASRDGSAEAVRRAAPWADLVALDRNAGAAARTIGVRRAATELVAFNDDDSFWEEGALERAAGQMAAHRRVGLVAARVLVGPEGREDPVSRTMAGSPLPPGEAPGRPVLGFLACAVVVRRDAFLDVGGFHERLGIGGEEELLAIDLADAGWELVYLPEVVARHHPAPRAGDGSDRRARMTRNAIWCAWLRRPLRSALAVSAGHAARGLRDAASRRGVVEALRRGGWVRTERRVVAPSLERRLRLLDG